MKKLFTILVFLTFCTAQTTWAEDVIIVDSNGQAIPKNEQYQDYSKSVSKANQPKKENIMSNGKNNESYAKSKVAMINYNDSAFKHYDNMFRKYLVKKHTLVGSQDDIIDVYGESCRSAWVNILQAIQLGKHIQYIEDSKKDYDIYEENLQNGDYILFFKGKNVEKNNFIVECNKDNQIMGVVFYRIPKMNKNSTVLIFDEYRFVDYRVQLKHTMVLYKDKIKNSVMQFVYDSNQNVLCYQMDDNIYVSKENKNFIVDVDQWAFQDFEQKQMAEDAKQRQETADAVINAFVAPVLAPVTIPAAIVVLSPWVLKDGQ